VISAAPAAVAGANAVAPATGYVTQVTPTAPAVRQMKSTRPLSTLITLEDRHKRWQDIRGQSYT
jgi:hypothetical protein